MGWMQRGNKSTANLPQTLWLLLIEKLLNLASGLFMFGFTFLSAVSLFFAILSLVTLGGWVYLEELQSEEFPNWRHLILKDCSPWMGSTLEQGRKWGGRSGRENLLWTDCNPHSLSPHATVAEEVEKPGLKEWLLICENEEEKAKGSSFVFVPHYATL